MRRSIFRFLQFAAAAYILNGVVRKGFLLGNLQILSSSRDARMTRILSKMNLAKPGTRFWPTFFAHDAYLQMALFLFWKSRNWNTVEFNRHVIPCDDGGEVAVDVCKPPKGKADLPHDAPVLVILHTITGRSKDEAEFCRFAFERGWRPVVLNRRGHFTRLKNPKFNVMGCAKDTKTMINFVAEMFPKSFIGACGVSAGSGQIVSYIGQQEESGPVKAAVSLCPAYCMRTAFVNFNAKSPTLAKYILQTLKRFFIFKNRDILEEHPAFEGILNSNTVQEFVEKHVHFAGFDTFEDYLLHSNPMSHYEGTKVPCLILNSEDDPLCVVDNIPFSIVSESTNFALVLTKFGSHVAFREGLLGESCFMHRLTLDFLEAARKVNGEDLGGISS